MPHSSGHGWSWLLGASLVLNAVLVIGALKSRHPAPLPPPAHASAHAQPRIVRTAPAPVEGAATPAAPAAHPAPFRWASLESTNYAEYVANLRAFGCPEPLVRDLLAAELEDTFAPAFVPPPGVGFWSGGEARHAAEQDNSRKARARKQLQHDLYRQLFGLDWPVKEMRDPEAIGLVSLLADFLPEQQLDEAARFMQRLDTDSERLRDEVDGLTLPEDDARLLAVFREWETSVRARFGEAAWEEALLRAAMIKEGPPTDELGNLGLSGPEFRAAWRLVLAGTDVAMDLFARDLRLPDEDRRETKPFEDGRTLEALGALLGPARAAGLARNLDPHYRPIRDFIRQHDLSQDVGDQLYASRQAAEDTRRWLMEAGEMSPEARQEYLKELAAAAQLRALQVLPGDQVQAYLPVHQAWAKQLLESAP